MLLVTGAAAADITKDQCIDANTNGQVSRKENKLSDARAQFLLCSDSKCPEVIRNDCSLRFAETDGALPAIVFEVKDGKGADLATVTISVDGKPLAEKADGTALVVDPGQHEFTFEAQGEPTITKSFVIREGEKTRHEKISFAPEAPPPPPAPPLPAPPPADDGSAIRTTAVVLAGVGVVALGIGIVGGVEASSNWSDQKKDCASSTNCRDRAAALWNHSATVTWGSVSTLSIIAAVALIGGGAVLYFLAPSGDSKTSGQLQNPLRFSF
jgi:hypothetical protein